MSEENKNHLIILSIVAIVAITGLVFLSAGQRSKTYTMDTGKVEGANQADLAGQASEAVATQKSGSVYCEDSDYGWNFEVKGTTSLKKMVGKTGTLILQNTDACETQRTGTYLREYYCVSSNKMGSLLTFCYNGCSDGACIPYKYTSVTIHCWDGYEITDGGCYTINDWYSYADKVCSGRCLIPTDKQTCGVEWMKFGLICEIAVLNK